MKEKTAFIKRVEAMAQEIKETIQDGSENKACIMIACEEISSKNVIEIQCISGKNKHLFQLINDLTESEAMQLLIRKKIEYDSLCNRNN